MSSTPECLPSPLAEATERAARKVRDDALAAAERVKAANMGEPSWVFAALDHIAANIAPTWRPVPYTQHVGIDSTEEGPAATAHFTTLEDGTVRQNVPMGH